MIQRPHPDFLHPWQEDEFLPPIRRWTTLATLLLLGILAGTAGLSAIVKYNVTVEAIANVRPMGDLGIVQAKTNGAIQRVLVRENQVVQQGDVIAEVATLDRMLERSPLFSLQTRRNELQRYIQQYQEQIQQLDRQIQTVDAEIVTRAAGNHPMPPMQSVQLQPVPQITLETELAKLTQIAPDEAKRLTGQRDRLQQQRKGLANQIVYDQQTLQGIDGQINQQAIVAPVDGIVLKLEVQNPGQAIHSGEVIAQIVPHKLPLVIKARVNTQDISQVQLGQTAQLRISAYPYPDYGTLSGTVQSISPDVITLRDVGTGSPLSYYEVLIEPEKVYLEKNNRRYPLQPGMEVNASIISRQETILRSLLRKVRLWTDL
jgi:HlyD family secretion protein